MARGESQAEGAGALGRELAQALRALELGDVPSSAATSLFSTGGTAVVVAEEDGGAGNAFAKNATLGRLRRLDRVFGKLLRSNHGGSPATSGNDDDRTRGQADRVWKLLASDEFSAEVIGEDQNVAVYRSLFTLLHATINIRDEFNNLEAKKKPEVLAKALVGAKIYLTWLQLPGGSAYGLFMPYVFRQVLDLLRKWVDLAAQHSGGASVDETGSNGGGRKRRGAAQRSRDNKGRRRGGEADGGSSASDSEGANHRHATQFGLDLLDILASFLRTASLASSRESIMPTIETQVYLQTSATPVSDATASAMLEKTQEVLTALVGGSHGDTMEIARAVLHCYVPGLAFQDVSAKENRSGLRFHKFAIEIVNRLEHHVRSKLQNEVDEDERDNRLSVLRLALVQNVCMQAPDRSEERQRVLTYALSAAIGKGEGEQIETFVLRAQERVRFCRFLASYTRTTKAKNRQFGVELVTRLIGEHEFWNVADESIPRALVVYAGVGPLLDVLIDRSRDKMSSVRAKAIAGLSAALAQGLTAASRTAPSDAERDAEDTTGEAYSEAIASSLQALLYEPSIDENGNSIFEETALLQRLTELFREGLTDDKTFVRRAAIQALEASCVASPGGTTVHPSKRQDLFDIHGRCTDSSVIVRVQAVKSLSAILLRFPRDDDAQKLWNIGVLPLCVDAELTVQTCAVEWSNRVLFERLVQWYDMRRNDERRSELESVWSLVSHLDGVMAKCAQKALHIIVKEGKVDIKKLIRTCTHAIRHCVRGYTPDEDEDADDPRVRELSRFWGFSWIVLEELAHSGKLIEAASQGEQHNLGIVVECWNKLQDQELPVAFNEGSKRILRVIAAISPVIDAQDAKEIADSILVSLNSFAIPMNVISDAVLALNSICKSKAPTLKAGREISFAWGKRLLDICEENMRRCIEGSPEIVQDQTDLLQKQLISIGDVALLEFDKDNDKNNDSEIALLPVSSAIKSLVQIFLPPKIVPAPRHEGTPARDKDDEEVIIPSVPVVVEVPTPVRVCAFVTLGKLCLRDQKLAKSCITMLIRELRTCPVHDIRANILLILGDLCLRYTSLVDAYVPTIALSLLDKSALLRRSALLLFSQLILQDYIKWRESLLRFFLRAAVDKHEDLSNLARHILCGPLLRKTPHLFTSKFVEMIFVLNGNKGKLIFSEPFEKEGVHELALPGNSRFQQRAQLYQFLLQHMSDEQKLQVSMKLCSEILEEVTDNKLLLCNNPSQITDTGTEAVLKDTFAILCSPDIKLSAAKDEDDDLEGEDGGAAAAGGGSTASAAAQLAAAKGKLLSKMSKKNFLENVVPILIGLKHKLESKHSPLMRYLLHYTRELFKLYRQEVKAIFMDTDPQILIELEYDLRQYELQQKQQQEQEARRGAPVEPDSTPTKPPSPTRRHRSKEPVASPLQSPGAAQTPIRTREDAAGAKSKGARQRRRQSLQPTPTPNVGVRKREVSSDEARRRGMDGGSVLLFSPSQNGVTGGSGGRWNVTASSPAVDRSQRGIGKFTQGDLEETMRKDLASAFESASESSSSSDRDDRNTSRHVNASRRKGKANATARRDTHEVVAEAEVEESDWAPTPAKKKAKKPKKAAAKPPKAKARAKSADKEGGDKAQRSKRKRN